MAWNQLKHTICLLLLLATLQLSAATTVRDESYLYFSGGVSDVQAIPSGDGNPSFAMEYLSGKGQLTLGPLYFQPTLGAEVSSYPTISTFIGETLSLYYFSNQYISLFAGPSISLDMRSLNTVGAFPVEIRTALEFGYSPPGKVRVGLQLPAYFQYNEPMNPRFGGVALFLAIPFGGNNKTSVTALNMPVSKWNF